MVSQWGQWLCQLPCSAPGALSQSKSPLLAKTSGKQTRNSGDQSAPQGNNSHPASCGKVHGVSVHRNQTALDQTSGAKKSLGQIPGCRGGPPQLLLTSLQPSLQKLTLQKGKQRLVGTEALQGSLSFGLGGPAQSFHGSERGCGELQVTVPAAWHLDLCTPSCLGWNDSGLEYETFFFPVAQGYSFSLHQGSTSPIQSRLTT